jgi:hypothetical protein
VTASHKLIRCLACLPPSEPCQLAGGHWHNSFCNRPKDWARRHLRRTVEHALERERAERTQTSSGSNLGWGGVVLAGGFLAAVVVLPRLWVIYLAHGLLPLVLLALPALIGVGGLYILWIRLSGRPLYDLELVKEKLNRPAARVELRLAVFAPACASPAEVRARLEHLVSAYRAYDLERGNELVAHVLPVPEAADTLCTPGAARAVATPGNAEHARAGGALAPGAGWR